MRAAEPVQRNHTPAWLAGAAAWAVALAPSPASAANPVAPHTAAVTSLSPKETTANKEPAASKSASKPMGGHIGVATTFVTFQRYASSRYPAADLSTRTISDQFNLAFPVGIGFKTSERVTFDFEAIVNAPVSPNAGPTTLTLDPGVLYNWGFLATGLRVALPINAFPAAIGIVPLVHKGLTELAGISWFVEADFPVIYHGSAVSSVPGQGTNSIVEFNIVFHTGIGF